MSTSLLIDATHFQASQATGVENYVRNLLPLLSTELSEQGVAVAWVGHSEIPPEGIPKKVRWIHSLHSHFWSQNRLLTLLNTEKPSLFFTPSGLPPLLYRGKIAITIHDMAVYVFPEAFSSGERIRIKAMMKLAAKQAKVIFTVSNYSREQITSIWGIKPERITVTPLSFSPSSTKPEPLAGINPEEPIAFFISRIETKKNVIRLVEAFAQLNDPTVQLVLAGKDGFGAEVIRHKIATLPSEVRSRIFLPGFISDGEREWLLSKARVVLVPSALEGSSLPLMEALAHGVPTVCAKAGPLPEIGGEASLYAHPDRTEEWIAAIESLLTDSQLHTQLSQKAQDRAKTFTWESTARLTAERILTELNTSI